MNQPSRRRILGSGLTVLGIGFFSIETIGVQEDVRRGTNRVEQLHQAEPSSEPVPDWMERECGEAAALRVEEYLRDVFDEPRGPWEGLEFDFGQPNDRDLDPGVLVEYILETGTARRPILDRPDMEYDTLVQMAPHSVSASIDHEGTRHTCVFPIWVQKVARGVSMPT